MSDLTVRGIKIENLEKRIAEMEAEDERLRKGLRLIIGRPPGQAHRIAIQMLEAERNTS